MTKKTAYEERWKEYSPQEARQHSQPTRHEYKKPIDGSSPEGLVDQGRSARHEMIQAWQNLIDYFRKKIDKPS